MGREQYHPGEGDRRITVKVPASLWETMDEAARRNRRSLQLEILTALQEHYGKEESR